MYMVLAPAAPGAGAASPDEQTFCLQPADATGAPSGPAAVVSFADLPAAVRRAEQGRVRWVWDTTRSSYLPMLKAGARVERCHDLTLTRNILSLSEFVPGNDYVRSLRQAAVTDEERDGLPRQVLPVPDSPDQFTLFDSPQPRGRSVHELVRELQDQLSAVAGSSRRGRLQLLVAAESAGALLAVEMEDAGVPWREDIHEQILAGFLGPRPRNGERPIELEKLAARLRELLDNPRFNPDSAQELLRALHRAGIEVKSTRSWELQEHNHPAIAPLLEYKKLSRLHSANGWTWLDTWVRNGRFRPEYIVGGVVTGRWASRGGGALQIPQQIRDAARPDPGHKLVVADAAQLEPRVLAALAQDSALAAAARGRDLYQGIADVGFGGDRAKAKVAMLGAMYGATTGESGRLVPQLTRTYPQAIGILERAARTGEAGGIVSSYLGRSCAAPSERWLQSQRTTTAEEQRRADSIARTRGRFTRNFIVQSTAAEWALCWLAELRRRLRAATAEGTYVGELVFFLHDEVMLHADADQIQLVCRIVEESAAEATRLMFGPIPIEFAVSIAVVNSYADAK